MVAVDESGSMSADLLRLIWSELAGILEASPAEVTIIRHTTQVRGEPDTWHPGDPEPAFERRYTGGTSHHDVARVCGEIAAAGDPIVAIWATDLDTSFPPEPEYPVLWLTKRGAPQAPWGRRVEIRP